MPRPTICTTLTTSRGVSIILYRIGPTYHVGLLSSHRRPVPLADSTYATYGEAHTRLLAEAQQRQHA